MWFRQDLRLADNPALYHAAQSGSVLPLYILDDETASIYRMGRASRWWLHSSLHSLHTSLQGLLRVYRGNALAILQAVIRQHQAQALYYNRCYEPWRINRDTIIKQALGEQGVAVHSFNGSLLAEPWKTVKKDGTPYLVFTPFYKHNYSVPYEADTPSPPLPAPQPLRLVPAREETSSNAAAPEAHEIEPATEPSPKNIVPRNIDALGLLPAIPWYTSLAPHWQIGEQDAKNRLQRFLQPETTMQASKHGLFNYKEGRDFPAQYNTSRLSPHLHFGELSPRQVWQAAAHIDAPAADKEHFLRELCWREFSYSLLYYYPHASVEKPQKEIRLFSMERRPHPLAQWQKGQTGYPIVDAGMRELWQTGYMHNRIRMVTASFLVKNLLIHWKHGEAWFWDCLLDADLANNSASWQWVAGCGADAAPYFSYF